MAKKKARTKRYAQPEPIDPRGRLDILAVRLFERAAPIILHPDEAAIFRPHVESFAAEHLTPAAIRRRFPSLDSALEAWKQNPELARAIGRRLRRKP